MLLRLLVPVRRNGQPEVQQKHRRWFHSSDPRARKGKSIIFDNAASARARNKHVLPMINTT